MKQPRKVDKTLLIIGLILILSLFFANKIMNKPNSQVVENTPIPVIPSSPTLSPLIVGLPTLVVVHPSPTPPDFPTHVALTLTAMPTASPTATIPPTATSTLQPPACTFPLAGTTSAESTPQEYTFSEPQVVLTDELQPDIIDWLPDNQNVLIMPWKLIDLGKNGYRQTIELFNPETKETRIYATRRAIDEAPPAWNPVLNAIVYPNTNVLEGSTLTDFRFTRQVMISYGNPDDTQLLADNLPQYPMAVKPDGSQMAYLLDKQLFRLDAALKPLAPVSYDRKRWDYRHDESYKEIEVYKMAWRPNSAQIFLYNHAIDGLGYTYILDTDSGRLCNLNFDGWATAAHWSPNGRYLAIIMAQGAVPIESADVAVLDTATGDFYTLKVVELEIKGGRFVQAIAWAPDNRHLLFTVETSYSESTYTYDGLLYLGDFISGQAERILSSYQFNIHSGRTNLAWSPDGSKLLMNCPTSEGTKQVCLIPVQTGGQ